jgi:hypothetical protein
MLLSSYEALASSFSCRYERIIQPTEYVRVSDETYIAKGDSHEVEFKYTEFEGHIALSRAFEMEGPKGPTIQFTNILINKQSLDVFSSGTAPEMIKSPPLVVNGFCLKR